MAAKKTKKSAVKVAAPVTAEEVEDHRKTRDQSHMMGNQWWKARSRHGNKPIFASPEELQQGVDDYFEWIEANPLISIKPMTAEGKIQMVEVPLARATTIQGLCVFLDIGSASWYDYANREGFSEITEEAKRRMYAQKFTGASAGVFNANIIARDLGLTDKSSAELTGKDGGAIETKDVSDIEFARRLAFLLQKGINEPK